MVDCSSPPDFPDDPDAAHFIASGGDLGQVPFFFDWLQSAVSKAGAAHVQHMTRCRWDHRRYSRWKRPAVSPCVRFRHEQLWPFRIGLGRLKRRSGGGLYARRGRAWSRRLKRQAERAACGKSSLHTEPARSKSTPTCAQWQHRGERGGFCSSIWSDCPLVHVQAVPMAFRTHALPSARPLECSCRGE